MGPNPTPAETAALLITLARDENRDLASEAGKVITECLLRDDAPTYLGGLLVALAQFAEAVCKVYAKDVDIGVEEAFQRVMSRMDDDI